MKNTMIAIAAVILTIIIIYSIFVMKNDYLITNMELETLKKHYDTQVDSLNKQISSLDSIIQKNKQIMSNSNMIINNLKTKHETDNNNIRLLDADQSVELFTKNFETADTINKQ